MENSSRKIYFVLIGLAAVAFVVWAYSKSVGDSSTVSADGQPSTAAESISSETSISTPVSDVRTEILKNSSPAGTTNNSVSERDPKEFSPDERVWLEFVGIDDTRRQDANFLVYRDLEAIERMAAAGDIYAMEALGTFLRVKEPERAYEYFLDATVHGSVFTLSHLSNYHMDEARSLKQAGSSDAAREQELKAVAFNHVASLKTNGFWGEMNKAQLVDELSITDEEVPVICAETARIVKEIDNRRTAEGIVPFGTESPFSLIPDDPPFTCQN